MNILERIKNTAKLQSCISVGGDHTVVLKTDGTVLAVGKNKFGQCNTQNWRNIIAVSAGYNHTVGLKANGTVVAVGENDSGQCNTQGWQNIVAIAACSDTYGLKSDGTVICTGVDKRIQDWRDIVAISVASINIVGLKADGTVVAVGDDFIRDAVKSWRDIIAVSTSDNHTVGLKADGTVNAAGKNEYGKCNIEYFQGIIAVSAAGSGHTVGLKVDGTVVAIGCNMAGQCNTQSWQNIVAVSAGAGRTVGVKVDGTVVAVIKGRQTHIYNCQNAGLIPEGKLSQMKQNAKEDNMSFNAGNGEAIGVWVSSKNWWLLLVLSISLGWFGIDRFYAGRIGLGLLKLITSGGWGIWWLIDVILVLIGKYKDDADCSILR